MKEFWRVWKIFRSSGLNYSIEIPHKAFAGIVTLKTEMFCAVEIRATLNRR